MYVCIHTPFCRVSIYNPIVQLYMMQNVIYPDRMVQQPFLQKQKVSSPKRVPHVIHPQIASLPVLLCKSG